jgi:thymidylate synthase (FAD)
MQSPDNKQGRKKEPVSPEQAAEVIENLKAGQKAAYSDYKILVDAGLAKELARVNLPLSLYTEWYWQIDLHNLFRFLALRMDAHAQREIRDYARVILEISETVCPLACASFRRHMLNGLRLSSEEATAFSRLLAGGESGLSGRELERLSEKLEQFKP